MIACNFCDNRKFKLKYLYKQKPKKETDFGIKKKNYKRCYIECMNCNHYYSLMSFDINKLYSKKYSESTYGKKIYKTFKKIINLPNSQSDNFFRLKRFLKYFKSKNISFKKVIDIGSGTGVFPYSLLNKDIHITCLEPDTNLSKHLSNNLGLTVVKKDFFQINFKKKYNVVTLNKVLEHVQDPFKFMHKIYTILKKNGVVYIEVPDTISASRHGKNREEFFVEHLHGFSNLSLKKLFDKTKFKLQMMKNIKEPSGKFTTYCFLTK